MTSRAAIIGIVLTGLLTLLGCILIASGLWLAFSRGAPASITSLVPSDTSGTSNVLPPASALHVGGPAPDFTLTGTDQQTISLSQLHGKAVLLNFWATWCGPCSAEMPNIEQVYQGVPHQDLAILAVNQGEFADQVRGYADLYHLHFPILLDDHGKVGNAYHVQALPTTVFVDRSGNIREVHIGGPMSVDFIQSQIKSLLQQTP